MKLTSEYTTDFFDEKEKVKYSVEVDRDDLTVEEIYNLFENLLRGYGYAQESIDKYFAGQ